MRLTQYTDYALRTLLYLAINRERLVTIQEIADAHAIAKNHLTKVVNHLSSLGLIDSVRGRNGGLRLAREPGEIFIGAVVRQTENDFYIAECFNKATQDCLYSSNCSLRGALGRATQAFLDVLDGVTLDTIMQQGRMRESRSNDQPINLQPKTDGRKKSISVSEA